MPSDLDNVSWIILSFISGSLILGIGTLVQYKLQKVYYLKNWAIFWFAILAAYVNLYFFNQSLSVLLLANYYSYILISGMLFMHASHRFFDLKVPKWLIIVDILLFFTVIIIGQANINIIIKLYAVFGTFASYILASGVIFIVKDWKRSRFAVLMIAILGLINLLYPFFYQTFFYITWGYMITSLSGTGMGIAIVGMHLMRIQRKHDEINEKLTFLSYHDNLTQLHNRAYMDVKFNELENEVYLPLSIIITDLNELKTINDNLGHRFGDEMLSKAAEIISSLKLDKDEIIRYGGDEFVIISPNTTEEETKDYVSKIQAKCQETLINGHPISIAIGYGIKTCMDQTLNDTFDEAEKWMYKIKKEAHQDKENIAI